MADTYAATIQINLLPLRQRARERRMPRVEFGRLIPFLALCAAVAGLAGVAGLEERSIRLTRVHVAELQAEAAALAPEQALVTTLRAEKANIERKIHVVQSLSQMRERAAGQIAALPAALPERLWVTDVTF